MSKYAKKAMPKQTVKMWRSTLALLRRIAYHTDETQVALYDRLVKEEAKRLGIEIPEVVDEA